LELEALGLTSTSGLSILTARAHLIYSSASQRNGGVVTALTRSIHGDSVTAGSTFIQACLIHARWCETHGMLLNL